MSTTDRDWSKPAAMAIPKEGYFELERGRYGPSRQRSPRPHTSSRHCVCTICAGCCST